jgi:hypothetical protein
MIYTIPDAQLLSERLAADLSFRGIHFRPCTQLPPRREIPLPADRGFWGRVNSTDTELERRVNHR